MNMRSVLSMKTEPETIDNNAIVTLEGNVTKSTESVTRKESNMDLDHTPVVVKLVGYELDELIGEGSFSKVHVPSHRLSDGRIKKVAVKVVSQV